MHELILILKTQDITEIEEYFSEISYSVWLNAVDTKEEINFDSILPKAGIWSIRALFEELPNQEEIKSVIKSMKCDIESIELKKVEEKDWVSENLTSFAAFECGDFYIRPSHAEASNNKEKIDIIMNSSAAFGTGTHETTSMILENLSNYKANQSFKKALDMGCGSGILSIGISKLYNIECLGIDIDNMAVSIAKHYAEMNRAYLCSFAVGQGYKEIKGIKFDLIVSNILANPLIEMARDCYESLNDGGIIMLSGFLEKDRSRVLQSYSFFGLKEIKSVSKKDWVTLILQRV